MIKVLGRVGFGCVIFLAVVGLFSVVRRSVVTVGFLLHPSQTLDLPPIPAAGFEDRYYAHPYMTLVHVSSGFFFMVLGPLQFMPSIRRRWLNFHRWCGRIFLIASLVGVLTALLFVTDLPVFGNFASRVGVVFASGLFLVALVKGYLHVRRREIAQHREWMIRLFAIGLGISTFRVLIPLLMMPPLRATFTEAWDTVVWLGFALNIVVAETWINLTRPTVRRSTAVTAPLQVAEAS